MWACAVGMWCVYVGALQTSGALVLAARVPLYVRPAQVAHVEHGDAVCCVSSACPDACRIQVFWKDLLGERRSEASEEAGLDAAAGGQHRQQGPCGDRKGQDNDTARAGGAL
uniref:Uncharacterized protein n=1 Tax=Cyanoptyche gloeocystis TaxID=77922 RepID=A0A7S2JP13_9EUKA